MICEREQGVENKTSSEIILTPIVFHTHMPFLSSFSIKIVLNKILPFKIKGTHTVPIEKTIGENISSKHYSNTNLQISNTAQQEVFKKKKKRNLRQKQKRS